MRIKKSEYLEGGFGFYNNDEYGHPEEFLSVRTIDKAQEIVNQLQKDIENLTKHNSRTIQSAKKKKLGEERGKQFLKSLGHGKSIYEVAD